jgi:hypothetical protein
MILTTMKTPFESFESLPEAKCTKLDLLLEDVVQHQAHTRTQLTVVFLRNAAYFNNNLLAQKDFSELVNTMIQGEDIILLQLLCPVPGELNDGVMLSLMRGKSSLQHLSPKAWASVLENSK